MPQLKVTQNGKTSICSFEAPALLSDVLSEYK